jgi:perosamine synthetase
LMRKLRDVGVDSRPYFYPISDMPMYDRATTPIAHDVSQRGINLPSYTDLSEADVEQICQLTQRALLDMRIL